MQPYWHIVRVLGVMFVAVSFLWLRPARADHWLAPTAYSLDNASRKLVNDLVSSMHHQYDGYTANIEVLAVLAGGALRGQAHALRTMVEHGNISDADLHLAAQELEHQMEELEGRVLHAHVTRKVRRDFLEIKDIMEAMLHRFDSRLSGRAYDLFGGAYDH